MLYSPVDSVSEASEYDSVPGESLYPPIKIERSRLDSRLNLSQNIPLPSVLVILVLNASSGLQ